MVAAPLAQAFGEGTSLDLEVEGQPPLRLSAAALSCEGANGSLVDWPKLRADLSFYVAVNLAPESITADTGSATLLEVLEAVSVLDQIPNPAAECLLGCICLKILSASALPERVQLGDFSTLRGITVHEALELLRRTADWHVIAASGWPIFALLAKLQWLLHHRFGASNIFNSYLESGGDTAFLVHMDESLAHFRPVSIAESALALTQQHLSPLTHAAALFSLADAARFTMDRDEAAGEVPQLVQRAAATMNIYLGASSGLPPLHLLSVRWPVFRLVDRLACSRDVELRLPAVAARPRPIHAVLPLRERASDVVRTCRMPYCDSSFVELLLRAAPPPMELSLLEVGANLGDCSLWAAAHFGNRLKAVLAMEPLPKPAEAFGRSVKRNGWEGKIRIVEAAASDRVGRSHFHLVGLAKGNPFAHASSEPHPGMDAETVPKLAVRTTTLAQVLPEWLGMQRRGGCAATRPRRRRPARVLKLYAFGGLPKVLRGAPGGFLRSFQAVWLALALDHQPSAPARALMQLGSLFSRHGLSLASPDLERDWCLLRRRGPAPLLRRLRRRLEGRGQGRVLPLVAFRPGSLACGRRRRGLPGQQAARRLQPEVQPGPPQCLQFFGLTARQRRARRAGAGYESYFLEEELLMPGSGRV